MWNLGALARVHSLACMCQCVWSLEWVESWVSACIVIWRSRCPGVPTRMFWFFWLTWCLVWGPATNSFGALITNRASSFKYCTSLYICTYMCFFFLFLKCFFYIYMMNWYIWQVFVLYDLNFIVLVSVLFPLIHMSKYAICILYWGIIVDRAALFNTLLFFNIMFVSVSTK